MKVTVYILYTLLLLILFYNIRTKGKKAIILNFGLILVTLVITWFFNGTFISRCMNNYQFEVEKNHRYEVLNLGYTIIPYAFHFIILMFFSVLSIVVMGIVNIIKKKENDKAQIAKVLFSVLVIYIISNFFELVVDGTAYSSIPDTYTKEMIYKEIKEAQNLIHLGILTNILVSNCFILINFKNKKENVSDVKGENS